MAEYYPLLAKAVDTLAAETYEARRTIYDRARKALIGQLRQMTPPVPESDINRESKALEAAIDKLEGEQRAKPKTPKPPPAPVNESAPVAAAAAPAMPPPAPRPALPSPPPWATPSPPPVMPRSDGEITLRAPKMRSPGTGANQEPVELPTLRTGKARADAARPAAPATREPRQGNLRWWVFGGVIGLVIVGIAGVAISLKQTRDDLARGVKSVNPAAPTATEPGSGKIVERIGGGTSSAPASTPVTPVIVPTIPVRPAAAPVQTPVIAPAPAPVIAQAPATAPETPAAAAPAPAAPAAVQPGIPVAYRAAILVDAPDDPQKVKAYVGTVVWRIEKISSPGKPPADAVRADIDIPAVKLKTSFVMQKNADATLPASHTMEIRFVLAPDSELGGVKAIKVPEMRKEDTPSGEALSGAPAPVIENFFFVGLSRASDADIARNLDLIMTRNWIDIPVLLTNDKIAKVTFEKGVSGDQVLTQAFEAWK